MNYLSLLTHEDVKYICSVIPTRDTAAYFQKNPKSFAKICPGFRANAITRLDVGALLYRNRNQDFVSNFIEKHIKDWLSQIQEHINLRIEDGDSKDIAYIHTLSLSFFADNVPLYFKLIDDERPAEYIAVLSSTVAAIKKNMKEMDQQREALKLREADINQLKSELDQYKADLQNAVRKLSERSSEVKVLSRTNADLEKLRITVHNNEGTIELLKAKVQDREESLRQLKEELSNLLENRQHLEEQIREELAKHQDIKSASQGVTAKPTCPKDIEEFKDYLGYNLESIGVPSGEEYSTLIKEHLCTILFQGIPIVVNRSVSAALIKCVANALIGTADIKSLAFNNSLTTQEINDFLATAGRIVCLDNFIGNFNETELLPLFDRNRNKVIFLTVAYDRTLNYVSDEFLRYCYYLNLNRIKALWANSDLTEDPSIVEEMEGTSQSLPPDSRYSHLLSEMLSEFGVRQGLIYHKCASINNEQDLCRVLAFDILPYCMDVLQIVPYNVSERLVKYAGNAGRCPYKNLLMGWFAG